MPMSPRLLRPRASGLVLPSDADARAYVLAVNSADQQPLEPLVVQAIDAFVQGCKADGIWSAIKASCILMGARTLSGALTPLVGTAPTNTNFVSGDYNRETGLIGNGTTKHLDTGRSLNADPRDNNHIAAYVSVASVLNDRYVIGSVSAATDNFTAGYAKHNRSSQFAGVSNPVNPGLHGSSRAASGSWTYVKAGGSVTTMTGALGTVGATFPNIQVFSTASANGQPFGRFDGRIAFYSAGEALNLGTLSSRVSTLYTAIGAAI